jgi:hypothetical protein
MNLTVVEKHTVCEIAKEAYDAWPDRAEWERTLAANSPGTEPFTAWRHQEQFNAVGMRSLTTCHDEHYRPLVRHFCRVRERNRAAASTLSLF